MRQLPSDKYNVAWFKLAEFVARGERERALGLYKLLIHSFDDHALALQLEGDLLLSFNDHNAACQKYREASQVYSQDKRYIEAAAVYEHVLMLDQNCHEDIITIIALYEQLTVFPRLLLYLEKLCMRYIHLKQFDQLDFVLQEWTKKLDNQYNTQLYKAITVALIKDNCSSDIIRTYLKKTLDHLVVDKDSSKPLLQSFLSTIEALHKDFYCEATQHIQEL